MGIVLSQFGKNYISEKKTFQYVTDNVDAVLMRLVVKFDVDYTFITELTNSPDLGTSDTFTFELNSIGRQLYQSNFFELGATTALLEPAPLLRLECTEIEEGGVEGVTNFFNYLPENITVQNFIRNTFDLSDYVLGITGSSTSLFKTSSPKTLDLKEGDTHFLGVNEFSLVTTQEGIIESYNSAGTLIVTDTIALIPQVFTVGNYPVHNVIPVTMESGVSYKLIYVQDVNAPNTVRSEVFRLNNPSNCATHHLHWINEFGVQDSYYFMGEVSKAIGTESSVYEKSTPVNPTDTDYGLRVFDNTITDSWVLYTDSISQSTVNWLKNIFVSKKIAVEIDGFYYPAALNSDKLTYYKDINGIYQINISITFSNKQLGNN